MASNFENNYFQASLKKDTKTIKGAFKINEGLYWSKGIKMKIAWPLKPSWKQTLLLINYLDLIWNACVLDLTTIQLIYELCDFATHISCLIVYFAVQFNWKLTL